MESQQQEEEAFPPPPSLPDSTPPPPPPRPPPPPFDPSRMIGIIKRKALIKELAAVYHAECLAYCQELLELQRKWDEPYIDLKTPEDTRKETLRPSKRLKKTR
nr:proline-rich protein 11 [Ziziphus jujuba var. spinosa]